MYEINSNLVVEQSLVWHLQLVELLAKLLVNKSLLVIRQIQGKWYLKVPYLFMPFTCLIMVDSLMVHQKMSLLEVEVTKGKPFVIINWRLLVVVAFLIVDNLLINHEIHTNKYLN